MNKKFLFTIIVLVVLVGFAVKSQTSTHRYVLGATTAPSNVLERVNMWFEELMRTFGVREKEQMNYVSEIPKFDESEAPSSGFPAGLMVEKEEQFTKTGDRESDAMLEDLNNAIVPDDTTELDSLDEGL